MKLNDRLNVDLVVVTKLPLQQFIKSKKTVIHQLIAFLPLCSSK